MEKTSRRKFVRNQVINSVGLMIVPRHVLGGKGFIAPSDRVQIGVVGAGGRGKQNVSELLKEEDVQITAVADPARYWNLANFYYRSEAGRGPVCRMIESHDSQQKVAEYKDFRKMLDQEKDLDAVLCAPRIIPMLM